jgi:hypothetical protein
MAFLGEMGSPERQMEVRGPLERGMRKFGDGSTEKGNCWGYVLPVYPIPLIRRLPLLFICRFGLRDSEAARLVRHSFQQ